MASQWYRIISPPAYYWAGCVHLYSIVYTCTVYVYSVQVVWAVGGVTGGCRLHCPYQAVLSRPRHWELTTSQWSHLSFSFSDSFYNVNKRWLHKHNSVIFNAHWTCRLMVSCNEIHLYLIQWRSSVMFLCQSDLGTMLRHVPTLHKGMLARCWDKIPLIPQTFPNLPLVFWSKHIVHLKTLLLRNLIWLLL